MNARLRRRRSFACGAVGLAAATSLAVVALSCVRQPREGGSGVASGTFDGCGACHAPIAAEVKGTKHFKWSLRCVTCHGHSKAHMADAEVKPDEVFSGVKVDYLCSRCHQDDCRHEQTHKTLPPGTRRKTCADCHGAHEVKAFPTPSGRSPR